MSNYSDKLRDPRWQRRRLEIMQRDEWTCQKCGDKGTTLNVHHRKYKAGADPWDYEDNILVTLCECCHEVERQSRGEYENMLISIMKEHLWSDDIYDIVEGFLYYEKQYQSSDLSGAIRMLLSNKNLMKSLVEFYLKNSKK